MKDIKIAVACHKDSALPNNKLYYPVQVGAALAKKKLNMVQDDSGDNISEKNSMYCELTAQYWAWKNWDADYYGLCHYRRYLYFGERKFETDLRRQIVAETLSPYTCKKYGLNDDLEMRAIIENSDCVVGNLEDVRILPTPYGCKKTVYEHWVAHDRALIMKHDLDNLIAIINRKYPELGKDAQEYLKGYKFLGYNCFVMRKELFHQLCEFEFDVLSELEKTVDSKYYNQQLNRIYGFMGEILYSVFIYHLEKSSKYKITHIPVLYFNQTDIVEDSVEEKERYTICLMQENTPPFMLAPMIESFLDNCNENQKYELIVAHENMDTFFINSYKSMIKDYPNVILTFLNLNILYGSLKELLLGKKKEINISLRPFLPWVLKNHEKVLVVDWNHLFRKNIDSIFTIDLNDYSIASPINLYEVGRINGIYPDDYQRKNKKIGLKNVYEYFNHSIMLMDLEKIRSQYTAERIAKLLVSFDIQLTDGEITNKIYEGAFKVLDAEWGIQTLSNTETRHHIPYAPNELYSEYRLIEKDPIIMEYFPDDPWYPLGNQFDTAFWHYARKTPFYETFFAHMIARRAEPEKRELMVDKLFPRNTKRRSMLLKIIPKKSKRYEVLKKVYDYIRR